MPARRTEPAASQATTVLQWTIATIRARVPFQHYAVFGAPFGGRGPEPPTLLAHDWPGEFKERFFDGPWHRRDPMLAAASATSEPVASTAAIEAAVRDPEMKRRLADAQAALGAFCAAVPVRLVGRLSGVAAFYRREPEFSAEDGALLRLAAPALHFAALQVVVAATSPEPLTLRERECLALTSRGKTAREIGLVLGISEHTAVAHLNAAARKLGATTRTNAVAEALRRGLID